MTTTDDRHRDPLEPTLQFIARLSPDGLLLDANRTTLESPGRRDPNCIGKPLWDNAAWCPELRHRLRDAVSHAGLGQEVRFEAASPGPDDRLRHYGFLIRPVRGEHGSVTHLVAEGIDITQRAEPESTLEATGGPGQQRLQAQKMEALGQLAAGVAHDFNNMLLAIAGRAELLLVNEPNAATRRGLEQICRATDRAATITRQLLGFARSSPPVARTVRLGDLLRESEEMFRSALGANVTLAIQPAPDELPVSVDGGEFGLVVLNLVLNARDAMPNGGTLSIMTRNHTVEESADGSLAPGAYVALAVGDTGMGMTPEVRAHLFEPFFTTKDEGKGTGLGLTGVRRFVRRLGGHLEIDSAIGRGTTVTLYAPAARNEARSAPTSTPRPDRLAHETVLLVEDDEAVREVLQSMLERRGYTVLAAAHGAAALAVAAAHPGRIDLVLPDVVLPGMSGPQLVEQLRRDRGNIPVLFISGHAPGMPPDRLSEVAFLQKPFSPADLSAKVREVLDRP